MTTDEYNISFLSSFFFSSLLIVFTLVLKINKHDHKVVMLVSSLINHSFSNLQTKIKRTKKKKTANKHNVFVHKVSD